MKSSGVSDADAVINYKAVPDWGQKAKDLTDGRGVDHVIEVGGPGTLTQSIAACRMGSHIAMVDVLTGFAADSDHYVLDASRLKDLKAKEAEATARALISDWITRVAAATPK